MTSEKAQDWAYKNAVTNPKGRKAALHFAAVGYDAGAQAERERILAEMDRLETAYLTGENESEYVLGHVHAFQTIRHFLGGKLVLTEPGESE